MTPCPWTPIFELTEQLIGHLQAEVRRAHLEGDERGISAGLVLERDGLEMIIPCHPAASEPPATGLDTVQAWLDQVWPADFGDGPAR
jgi:hypothetical protein